MSTKILSRAPTRVDLSGGTLDIWPLYLFLKDPLTLNLGIDLFAETELTTQINGQPGVTLRSADQNFEQKLSWQEVLEDRASVPAQLVLHYRLLRYFCSKNLPDTDQDLVLSTRAKSPAGAGLGGSSTLSIAMIGALAQWSHGQPIDPERDGEKYIEIVRDVETTVIQVPAGMQDYYGAMFGGLQSLRWQPGYHLRKWMPVELLKELESRLMLFYSGQSRNSGINNWALFKHFIDREGPVRTQFEQINAATHRLEQAILSRDWVETGKAISEEWSVRKNLAPGITTPEIDLAMAQATRLSQVHSPRSELAGKICGAGGGGCFFVYHPELPQVPELRSGIQKSFEAQGMRLLPFHSVPRGLEVTVALS